MKKGKNKMASRLDYFRNRDIPELEELASRLVGDGGNPNLFFVSVMGNIKLVTRDFKMAYSFWKSLPTDQENSLEDRQTGCICCVEPKDDDSSELVVIDNTAIYEMSQKHR